MGTPEESHKDEAATQCDETKLIRLLLPSGSVMDISGLDEEGVQKLLELFPEDVRIDMATGGVNVTDKGFLESVKDHVHELVAPANATRKEVRRKAKELMSGFGEGTIKNTKEATGRNEKCPCGSGKKYKQCCLGKKRK